MSKLVELIVVLVILALLMAVLIPALLGWIDKARQSQITTNANAAYVATQGLLDEYYGTVASPTADGAKAYVTVQKIQDLTKIKDNFTFTLEVGTAGNDIAVINSFTYSFGGKTATWDSVNGTWSVA